MRGLWRHILAGGVAAVLAVFLLWPIFKVVGASLGGGGEPLFWLRRVFVDPSIRQWLINAAEVALCTTALTALLGLPLAILADRVSFRGKSLASAMLMAPMILPPFVGALAFNKMFSRNWGSVNLILKALGLGEIDFLGGGFRAVVILEALHLYPILYLNAVAALGKVDPTLAEAARNLGASRVRVFWRITLPLIRPGLFAGMIIVFIWSFCELGTPLMVNYHQVLPVKIYEGLQTLSTPPHTFAMVVVMLGASVGTYAVGRALLGRTAATAMGGRLGGSAGRKRAGSLQTVLCWSVFAGVTLVAVIPHVGVVLMSVSGEWVDTVFPVRYTASHLAAVFRDSDTWNSIANSLRYAGMSTLLCTVLGLVTAYLVVRLRVRGSALLDSASMLPLAVPGLVMAAGYVAITTPPSVLAGIGPARNPTALLVIAYTIRRLPYVVRSISAGLQQTPASLEEAGRNLGGSRLRVVMKVTVPLVAANILAGGILAFSFNMLEVSDSLILAQTRPYYPITKQLYELAGIGAQKNLAAALGVYGMVLLGATLVGANVLLGKRLGQLFRV